jgi:hypothetical protein
MPGLTTRSKKAATETPVTIDYPVENEPVFPGHYAIRVHSPEDKPVEISINDGPWVDCRSSNGYFWFDWWPVESGRHRIRARAVGSKPKKVSERICIVEVPHSN